jgi:hypothetical protein
MPVYSFNPKLSAELSLSTIALRPLLITIEIGM